MLAHHKARVQRFAHDQPDSDIHEDMCMPPVAGARHDREVREVPGYDFGDVD